MSNLKRNDPCHCGSGKKYKHCHMKADRARQTFGGSQRDVTDVIEPDTIPYFFWKEWKSARVRGEYALIWQMLDSDGPYASSFRDIDHFLLQAQKTPLPSGPEWEIKKIKLDEKTAFVLSTRGENEPTAQSVKLEMMHLIRTPQGWRLHNVDTRAVEKGEDEVFVAFDEFGIESADKALHLKTSEGYERPDLADYPVPDIDGGMEFFNRVSFKLDIDPTPE